jgi:hypothetical protein
MRLQARRTRWFAHVTLILASEVGVAAGRLRAPHGIAHWWTSKMNLNASSIGMSTSYSEIRSATGPANRRPREGARSLAVSRPQRDICPLHGSYCVSAKGASVDVLASCCWCSADCRSKWFCLGKRLSRSAGTCLLNAEEENGCPARWLLSRTDQRTNPPGRRHTESDEAGQMPQFAGPSASARIAHFGYSSGFTIREPSASE